MKRKVLLLTIVGSLYGVILLGILFIQRTKVNKVDSGSVTAANQLIEAGHFTEATQIYEQLIAEGVEDSIVYYNLGNAYYNQGDLGRAILNYERALQLSPRDGDIQANLTLARSQVQDPFAEVAPGPMVIIARLTSNWLNINETAFLILVFWFMTGMLFLAGLEIRQPKRRQLVFMITTVVFFLTIIGGLSLGGRLFTTQEQPEGVIVVNGISVSDQPGREDATGLALPSGTTVNLTEVRGDWAHLTAPGNSQQGWIPLQAVETVTGLPTPL